jgi:hypothetical protein
MMASDFSRPFHAKVELLDKIAAVMSPSYRTGRMLPAYVGALQDAQIGAIRRLIEEYDKEYGDER